MKTEDKAVESLIAFSVDMKISESIVALDIADEYHLGVLQYLKLCESLSMQGYKGHSRRKNKKLQKLQKLTRRQKLYHMRKLKIQSPEQLKKYDDIILKLRELELSHKTEMFHKAGKLSPCNREDEKSKKFDGSNF